MTGVLLLLFACGVVLLGFANMRAGGQRQVPPSSFAGVLVGFAISFIGLRPWITEFGSPLSIQLFLALLVAAASWAVVRNQVRITRHHVWWLFLLSVAFLVSFRAADISQEAIVTAAAIVVTVCLRVSVKGVMVGLLLAGYSMLFASLWFAPLDFGLRLSVLGENPIWIARVGVLGTIACLFSFETWRVRLVAALPLLTLVILTGSRGPLVSLLAGGLAFIVLRSRRPVLPLTGLVILVVATPLLAPISAADPILGGPERAGSISVRFDIWSNALDVWLANPLMGIGEPIDPRLLAGLLYPHNSVLDLLSRSGLIGFAFVLLAAVIAVRRPAALPFQIALVTAVWFSFTSGSIWGNWEMWMLLALTFSSRQDPRPVRGADRGERSTITRIPESESLLNARGG